MGCDDKLKMIIMGEWKYTDYVKIQIYLKFMLTNINFGPSPQTSGLDDISFEEINCHINMPTLIHN